MTTNRYLCQVLDEMRKAVETLNFSYLLGLIEEAQSMGNRMESKLEDIDDFKRWDEEKEGLEKELKALRKAKEAITGKKESRF